MRPNLSLLLAVALAVLFAGGVAVAAPDRPLPDGKHQVTFSIPDMECSMCSKSVTTELRRLKGVLELKIDDVNRLAVVRFDPAVVDVRQMQLAIKKAGFESHTVEPSPH